MATHADMQEIVYDIRSNFGIRLQRHRLIDHAKPGTDTWGAARRGIRVAGAAFWPETLDDPVFLRQAVASRAVTDLYALVQKTT